MQINRLRLLNFRQHENTEIEFGAGLTGIIGPNGAGKTTLLEAIAWAMYGMPAARGSRETLRRRGAPPQARVEVEMEFTLGAHQYRIVRSLNQAELYQDGDPAADRQQHRGRHRAGDPALGDDPGRVFQYLLHRAEGAGGHGGHERAGAGPVPLPGAGIRAAPGRPRTGSRRGAPALRARLDALRAGLPGSGRAGRGPAARPRAAGAPRRRPSARPPARGSRREETGRDPSPVGASCSSSAKPRWPSQTELRVADHKAAAAAERIARLEQEAAGGRMRRGSSWMSCPASSARCPRCGRRPRSSSGRRNPTRAGEGYRAQLDEVRSHLTSIEDRVSQLPSRRQIEAATERVSEARAALTAATLEAEEQRTVWVRDAQDAKTKRQGLLDQYQELKEQRQRIVKAGADGVCPTCARPLGAEYAKVLELLDRQIEEVRSNGNFYKQRIEQLQQEPAALTEIDRRRLELEQRALPGHRRAGSAQRPGPRCRSAAGRAEAGWCSGSVSLRACSIS